MAKTFDVSLEDELKSSYIDYAMSVIIGRAIPDARDGLKPAQRRILYTMYKLNNLHNQPTKKSARIVGDCLGKYHPHGDIAVYDTLVRMAQDFSMNHLLVEGQGNFGSIDGDSAAAQRYTEIRLTRFSEEILDGLEQETVQMVPNFDNTEKEPVVMPGKIPNLLINGASGIAVGVATSIPPHNLGEVCDAIIYRLKNKEATPGDILAIIKGPDFPTGGIVMMSPNTHNGYIHGRGQTTIRAKAEIDEKKNRIVVKEIPYNVNKSLLMQNIAQLVKDKRVPGIRDIRDESDRTGISIAIELKEGENANQILNMLYKHTQLEVTFPIINLAIIGKSLKSLNILQLIDVFVDHRREMILKRSKFELNVAKERLHIIDGLLVAIDNIDEVIKTIKESNEVADARERIQTRYSLSEKQANAILEMRLSRLTKLENNTLNKEKAELRQKIEHYASVINDPQRIDNIITEETLDIKKKYARPRRSEIVQSEGSVEVTDEDMISDDKVTIILTNSGYVKRMTTKSYKEQARGGKGIISINLKEGDHVKQIITCNNKDFIVCIANTGRIYWLKAYNVPESSRYAEGKAIVNLLNITDEKIVNLLDVKSFDSKIVFLTNRGLVKKIKGELFAKPRSSGVRAIVLAPTDEIADAIVYSKERYLIIGTKSGKSIKFDDSKLRFIGRVAMGVRGIKIKESDQAKNIIAANEQGSILTVTEKGFGKITPIDKYRTQGRGGKGVINLKVSDKTGPVSKCMFVGNEQHLILINSEGKSITIPIASIRVTGRSASGVRLMRMDDNATVADARLLEEEPTAQTQTAV